MSKKGKYNSGEFALFLANIFLGRNLNSNELEVYVKIFLEHGKKFDSIIAHLLECDERKNLIETDPYFVTQLKPDNSVAIIMEIKPYISSPIFYNYLFQEYLITRGEYEEAIRYYRLCPLSEFKMQAYRIAAFAAKINFIDYNFIVGAFFPHLWESISGNFLIDKTLYSKLQNGASQADLINNIFCNDIAIGEGYVENIYNNNFYNYEDIIKIMPIVLSMIHMPQNSVNKIQEILHIIINDKNGCKPQISQCKLLFVSGLGWSGAGAIMDYLKGNHNCYDIFPGLESSLFRGDKNIYSLYTKFNEDRESFLRELMLVFLYQILNLALPINYQNHFLKYHSGILRFYCGSEDIFINYLNKFQIFCKNIIYSYYVKDINIFRDSVSALLNNLNINNFAKNQKYIIFLNSITASTMDRLASTPFGTTNLIVFRNPKDQYISVKKYKKFDLNQYYEYVDNSLINIGRHSSRLQDNYRIIPILYEAFVKSREYRNNIAEKLGISSTNDGSPYFNPETSLKSIGKFKKEGNLDELAAVSERYPQLMDGSLMALFSENCLDAPFNGKWF